ncbi:hypothetical protein B484DRAFT_246958, partial [Ochromonadaceae sp. CCMP2298]
PQTTLEARYDEFALAQTTRSTYFRAARLEKARRLMDFVQPHEEAELIARKVAQDKIKARSNRLFKELVMQVSFEHMRYGRGLGSCGEIVRRLGVARARVVRLKVEMEELQESGGEAQEEFLLRHFIVDAFGGSKRRVVGKYLLGQYAARSRALEGVTLALLPVVLVVMIYYIFTFNARIGSRATTLWLVMVCIYIAQDLLLIKPLRIYVNNVVINQQVGREVREMVELLRVRTKLVMMRTQGMMKDADSLIQHFNPAARVARAYPHLPVARLLLSLNDHDIPLINTWDTWHSQYYPPAIVVAAILSVTLLPPIAQEVVLEICSSAMLNFSILGLIALGSISPLYPILIVVLLLGALAARETWLYRRTPKVQVEEGQWYTEGMFNSIEERDERVIGPKTRPRESSKMKELHMVSAVYSKKMGGWEEEEEEVVYSDLIDFGGVAALSSPHSAKLGGSVLSLRSFKRSRFGSGGMGGGEGKSGGMSSEDIGGGSGYGAGDEAFGLEEDSFVTQYLGTSFPGYGMGPLGTGTGSRLGTGTGSMGEGSGLFGDPVDSPYSASYLSMTMNGGNSGKGDNNNRGKNGSGGNFVPNMPPGTVRSMRMQMLPSNMRPITGPPISHDQDQYYALYDSYRDPNGAFGDNGESYGVGESYRDPHLYGDSQYVDSVSPQRIRVGGRGGRGGRGGGDRGWGGGRGGGSVGGGGVESYSARGVDIYSNPYDDVVVDNDTGDSYAIPFGANSAQFTQLRSARQVGQGGQGGLTRPRTSGSPAGQGQGLEQGQGQGHGVVRPRTSGSPSSHRHPSNSHMYADDDD